MQVVVIKLSPFESKTIADVTSISYANNTYTITSGSGSQTFSKDEYKINILW